MSQSALNPDNHEHHVDDLADNAGLSPTDLLDEVTAMPSAAVTRRKLVRKLADILALPADRLGWNERAFTTDLLMTTIAGMDMDVIQEVANRLARVADLPLPMIRFLAMQSANIAEAILKSKLPIPETILMEAGEISPEHRLMVADRDDLTSAAAEAIAAHDELPIFQRLLRNKEVLLTEPTLVRLVSWAKDETCLREALIQRAELRPEHGFVMFWFLSSAHRKIILQRFSLDRTVIQDALQSLFAEAYGADYPDPVVLKALKLIDRRHRPRGRGGEVVGMDMVERTLAAALANPSEDLIEAVSLLAGVGGDIAERVLLDPMGEPFAILCKSTGLSRGAFHGLFDSALEAGGMQVISCERQEDLLAIFDSLSRDYARTILRYWDWRKELSRTAKVEPIAATAPTNADSSYLGAV